MSAPAPPPEKIPEPLQSFCKAVAEHIQVAFELPLMASLGDVADVLYRERKYKVVVKKE